MMIDYGQLRKERLALGISQAKLSRETGISRTLLSSFETGKALLGPELSHKLARFFGERGVELKDISGPAPSGRTGGDGGLRVLDNLVVAPGIDDDDVEDLIDELDQVRQKIASLEGQPIAKGFFGDLASDAESAHKQLLLLFAQEHYILAQLQGGPPLQAPADGEDASTQGELLADELADLSAANDEDAQAA